MCLSVFVFGRTLYHAVLYVVCAGVVWCLCCCGLELLCFIDVCSVCGCDALVILFCKVYMYYYG